MAKYYKEAEFENWLENDTVRWSDPKSVSSYKSGVRSMIIWVDANKHLWKTTSGTLFLGFEDYLKIIDSDKDRETLLHKFRDRLGEFKCFIWWYCHLDISDTTRFNDRCI